MQTTEKQEINQQIQTFTPVPIPIERLWIPEKPDVRVFEAVRRLKSWPTVAEALFPGMAFAVPEFSERLVSEGDSHFDPLKELPVGIGAGRFGSQVPCVVTAVTEYLKIRENEALIAMREGSHAIKPGIRMSPTELQPILETLHRRVSRIMMYNMGMTMLHYIQVGLSNQVQPPDLSKEDTLESILEKLVESELAKPDGEFKDENARRRVADLVSISMRRLTKSPFEFSFIAQSMIRDEDMRNRSEDAKARAENKKRKPARDNRRFLETILLHSYRDEAMFQQALALVKGSELYQLRFRAKPRFGGDRKMLKMVAVVTDNPLIARASRHKDAGGVDITCVRTSAGNAGIYKNPALWKVELHALFRMIIVLELTKKKRVAPGDIDWLGIIPEDRKPGEVIIHPEVKHWRLTENSVLNIGRSMTQATELADKDIIEAIQHAFDPEGIRKWRDEHGIKLPENINPIADALDAANANAPKADEAVGDEQAA